MVNGKIKMNNEKIENVQCTIKKRNKVKWKLWKIEKWKMEII